MKDINGKKIKPGNFVSRICPSCGGVIDCGVVIKDRAHDFLLRDYENKRETPLEVFDSRTLEPIEIEIIMEKSNVQESF